jgi:cell division transport system permease protein
MNNYNLKIMTGSVITICYIIVTISFSFLQGITKFLERWGQTSELTIYLKHLPSPEEQSEIEKILLKYSNETNFEFVNSTKLAENLKNELPALSQEIDKNSELISFLPSHFIVTAQNSVFDLSPGPLFSQIKNSLKSFPIISEMNFGEPWLKKYSQFLLSIKGFSVFIYLALCLALLLVIGNSIRSSINTKKDEIEILELIGATPSMIRKPFLKEGSLISFISMCIALLISSATLNLIGQLVSKSYALFGLQIIVQPLKVYEIIFFLGSSLFLGFFGSYWVIKSHTDGFISNRS